MPGSGAVAARWAGWSLRLGSLPAAQSGAGATPPSVTFPTTLLGTRVELALGADLTQPWWTWVWEDITRFVRHADGITVSDGRQDEGSVVDPGKGSLRLDNTDNRFSRRNPNGPYYGLLTKNTPIRATIDPGSGWVPRMEMFVTEWPSRADRSLSDVTVPITCAGILRRLGQGAVLKSPLRRAYQALTTQPTNYWPLEEGDLATSGASGITGGARTFDVVSPGTFGGSPIGSSGAAAGLDFSAGGSLILPTGQLLAAAPTGWEFECTVAYDILPSLSVGQTRTICHAVSSGTAAIMGFGIKNNAGTIYWADYIFDLGGSGSTVALTTLPAVEAGRTYHVRMVGHQEGAGLRLTVYVDGVSVFDDGFNETVMMPTFFAVNTTYDPASPSFAGNIPFFSHAAFWNAIRATTPSTYLASDGYAGEQAHARIARLCSEEGVTFTGTASVSPTMGPQGIDTFVTLLREAEGVDLGVLYERGFGLGYQSRTERHNAPVALTMDFDQGHIFVNPEHADDDQRTRNRWTVSRTGGGEATIEDTANIALNGLYDDSAELNLETDAQCEQEASWLVHVGTVDEERWPRFDVNFASTGGATLIDDWLALPFGPRLNVLNPPDMYSPDPVDAFIDGREERWDQVSWDVGMFTTPASPYRILTVDDATYGRLDSDDTTLAADLDTTSTSVSIVSGTVAWVDSATYPTEFPFDVVVDGERMTVTAITGATLSQTLTVTRSVNAVVKAHTTGAAVSLFNPSRFAL